MDHEPPRPVTDALRLLLETCLKAAAEQEDVRRSLTTLNSWVARELDAMGGEGGSPRARSGRHGVLTPAGRGRVDGDPRDAKSDEYGKRITSRLATVVTRARWKAAACRLSLDKRARAASGAEAPARDDTAIEQREASLRERIATLPDTSSWMLDLPFGRRLSDDDALLVDDEQAARLAQVADCYDALATGAEIAIQLDESGAFRRSPAPAFLYLLAEAQSALLQSLADAPTRSDSDQRDVFLWLKEQTTRYRIYVDRYMRLDDPANASGSADLVERMRRTAREILDKAKLRRERSQLLSKIRYHVGKLEHQLHEREVESLRHAIEEWEIKGHPLSDQSLGEILAPLHELVTDGDETSEPIASLRSLLAHGHGSRQSKGDGAPSRRSSSDAARADQTLAEMSALLDSRSVALVASSDAEIDEAELEERFGAGGFAVVRIDVDGDALARASILQELLDGDTDLFLLGVRFVPEEYQSFKETCLQREKQFVRLPGALDARAIAHQISRQVGWRLRAHEGDERARSGK
ncbi:MAG: hypothetical protein VX015_00090 [Planctomycetota bacterium]|nr:hypothetical protein [Planctomycetota bacterium]